MRKKIILTTLWLLLPLVALAYHYGPGQDRLALEHTDDLLAESQAAVADENWPEAIRLYQDALAKLPKEKTQISRKIQLEIAKAKMQNSQLPEAREELAALAAEIQSDPNASPEIKQQVTSTLANARYYMTYLMKLEGKPDAEWEPEIEAARQEYKLLAQNSQAGSKHLLDLEATIRLARATPKELYGLPIPSQ